MPTTHVKSSEVYIGLFVYNCIFAVYVREIEYTIFIAFLVGWTLFIAGADGFICQLWPYGFFGAYPSWLFYGFLGMAFITMALFTISYLRLDRFPPLFRNPQQLVIAQGLYHYRSARL